MLLAGQLTVFYLFDVSEAIDLARARDLLGGDVHVSKLAPKPAIPSYFKYQVPPLQVDGAAAGARTLHDFRVRLKLFDYGVVSLSLTRSVSGRWDDLLPIAHGIINESRLEVDAEQLCRQFVDRIGAALHHPRQAFLSGLPGIRDHCA